MKKERPAAKRRAQPAKEEKDLNNTKKYNESQPLSSILRKKPSKQRRKKAGESQVFSYILRLLILVVDSGAWAIMDHSAQGIYMVLLRRRFKDKPGFALGAERIMANAGIKNRHTFCNAMNQLEAAGLAKRSRGPKKFHYVNLYEVPLDPVIDILNLKAELNCQRNRRTLMLKNDKSVNEKRPKRGALSKNDKATLVLKNDKATLVPKNDNHKKVLKVIKEKKEMRPFAGRPKKEKIKSKSKPHPPSPKKVEAFIKEKSKPFTERKTKKLDTSESAFSRQMDEILTKKKR